MVRPVGLLSLTLWLLLLTAAGGWAAAPVIDSVAITLSESLGDFANPSMEVHVLRFHDIDGAADLTQVTLQPPFGSPRVYTPDTSGDATWAVVGPDTVELTVDVSPWSGAGTTFTYTISDASANTDTITFDGAPPLTEQLTLTSPTETDGMIYEVAPTFAWTGAQPGADVVLTVLGLDWNSPLWQYNAGSATSATYNTDGTATQAGLTPGLRYSFTLETDKQVTTADPRVTLRTQQWCLHSTLVYSANPVTDLVRITRTSDRRGPSWVVGKDRLYIYVTDGDGYVDIVALHLTDPAGAGYDFTPSSPGWYYTDAHTARLVWETAPALGAPTPGGYVITVRDAEDHETTLTTPTIPANADFTTLSPTLDGVTTDTIPTFSWSAAPEAKVDLTLEEEGTWWSAPIWQRSANTGGSVAYNANGQATRAELLPGYSYLLKLHYYTESWLPGSRVGLVPNYYLSSRFTVSGAGVTTPTLPGKLAYGVCFQAGWDAPTMLLQYEPDSSARHWLGPVWAEYPNWAPDGSLLYATWDPMAINRDPLDGAPSLLPIATAAEFSPSPDGARIAYRDSEHGYNGGWLWVANVDGSSTQAIVQSLYARWPAWSPDGQWIAYRDGDGLADSLHLIRPDGTEAHPVPITGVAGYPGYTVGYSGESSWSPDSQRLVATFAAGDGAGGALHGLGLVPRDGGLLTPIYLDDADHICCAATHMPVWSPKGDQIAFASGRQLAPNPEWQNGAFETGVELWVMNADGSGEPQRLTYDQFFPYYLTWDITHTFTDVGASFWAFDAVEACAGAGIVQGYADGTYHPEFAVTRGQMAAFLARALCGGDDLVPTGPATATFSDVPVGAGFFRHIEFIHSQGLATGYQDGRYQPTWTVNRGQMAAFLARAMCGGEELVPTGPSTATFTDVAPDFGFFRHIEYLSDQGVTTGYHDGTFHPEWACNRGQMAVFVSRAFHLLP